MALSFLTAAPSAPRRSPGVASIRHSPVGVSRANNRHRVLPEGPLTGDTDPSQFFDPIPNLHNASYSVTRLISVTCPPTGSIATTGQVRRFCSQCGERLAPVEGSAPVVLTLHTVVDSPADWAVAGLVASAEGTSVEGTLEAGISLVEVQADSTVAAGGAKKQDC